MTYEIQFNTVTRQWHSLCVNTKRTIEQGHDRNAVIAATESKGYVWEGM